MRYRVRLRGQERRQMAKKYEVLQSISHAETFPFSRTKNNLFYKWVADEDLRAFLSRYCTSVSSGEKLRGQFGIWNVKRRFLVRLKMDPTALGSLLHSPGSSALGPHLG
ncbi:uncharacterized protein LOC124628187 [Tachysurus ichikawai]